MATGHNSHPSRKQAFTLMELVVVIIILGILAAVALPNYFASREQTNAQVAKDNLLAITAAQQKFNEDYAPYCAVPANGCTGYCISSGSNPTGNTATCGDTIADLNINLRLNNSSNDAFSYKCSTTGAAVSCPGGAVYFCASPYCCIACDSTVTLTVNDATVPGYAVTCQAGGGYCPN